MELRSGSRVQSGYASAEAARAACMGSARVQLAAGQHGPFDAAVRGVLLRWTALRLAVENGWAGDDDADVRAAELEQSILAWFYAKGAQAHARAAARHPAPLQQRCWESRRAQPAPQQPHAAPRAAGEHYAYELEEHLDDYLVEVFHVEAEDGSPAEARGGCALSHLAPAQSARPDAARALTRRLRRWLRCLCTCSRRARAATSLWRRSSRRPTPRTARWRPASAT